MAERESQEKEKSILEATVQEKRRITELLVEQERAKVLNTAYYELPCLTVQYKNCKQFCNNVIKQDAEDSDNEDDSEVSNTDEPLAA